MIDYIIQELSLLTTEDIIVIALALIGFSLAAYMQVKKDDYEIYDHQKVVVSTLNYTTNERVDKTIILDNLHLNSLFRKSIYISVIVSQSDSKNTNF